MSRERKFSLVFWLEENQYSIVKTIDVVDSRHARVGDRTMVRCDGEVHPAEILEISGNKSYLADQLDKKIKRSEIERLSQSKRQPKRKTFSNDDTDQPSKKKSKKKLQSWAELTAGDLVVKQMGRSFPSEPESNSPDLTISDDMWTDQEEDLEETVTGDRLLTKRLEKVEEVVISLVTGLNSLKEEGLKLNSKLRTYEYEGDSDHTQMATA
ncbi:uncharacterized protein LOC134178440 [Corticium candelabrum]|uniref:uncharacterized protein LOC134178440 n=1 Tax=Corticium candelabrum TaxID=121492 RepID=UPI002E26435B|nr:uncharacterized protein LOC134178440 [Corticium candelabrum]